MVRTVVVQEEEQKLVNLRDISLVAKTCKLIIFSLLLVLEFEVSLEKHHDFVLDFVVETLDIQNCVHVKQSQHIIENGFVETRGKSADYRSLQVFNFLSVREIDTFKCIWDFLQERPTECLL